MLAVDAGGCEPKLTGMAEEQHGAIGRSVATKMAAYTWNSLVRQ